MIQCNDINFKPLFKLEALGWPTLVNIPPIYKLMLFFLLIINNLVYPADAFDFSDDSSPGGTEGQKARSGKPSDKSKDVGSGLKKIFSGPKKVFEHVLKLAVCFLARFQPNVFFVLCHPVSLNICPWDFF